ncbi:hypothetical protein [Mycolicibacterium celeriflavum]|uniref:Uncharacterized protein n=1 Tax=Mycolicibacterium celeriflavum TaxID=1249101 RepID=A0A1X0BUU7_MYCCF|nr:hypothetical protein [Mycolicibacterium celeriflavum]MCV7237502.1 hypothetical protein [Mycolicibacterium celeriflavum]ORA47804.1 hypothetical protein BST21_11660 [Mycolicibacterium celeriflavum]BBY45863.1 hypothetical protein MCEL_41580 [Mycolicibacterium celeriflavum]
MSRLRPGWLVALCGAIVLVSAWLPWLTTANGGRVSAIGGVFGDLPTPAPGFGVGQLIVLLASLLIVSGAMSGRGFSARLASSAALSISVLLVVLAVWYYRLYVYPPVAAGYGLYLGVAVAVVAALLSVWAMVTAWAPVARAS